MDRFYYFERIYTPLEARVYCSLTEELLHRYGQLYLHCSLIYFKPFQLFLHSDQPSEGEIILFMVSASRGGCIIHAGGGGGHT